MIIIKNQQQNAESKRDKVTAATCVFEHYSKTFNGNI